jgi:hypothetical protein
MYMQKLVEPRTSRQRVVMLNALDQTRQGNFLPYQRVRGSNHRESKNGSEEEKWAPPVAFGAKQLWSGHVRRCVVHGIGTRR